MSALPKRHFTPEEYLLLEEHASYKSQYVAGEIFPMGEGMVGAPSMMGGAQPAHVLITTNLVVSLGSRFRGRPCLVFSTDMRVASKPGELYTYPDVAALCGEPHYDRSSNPPSLLNPQVIVEVLSPSTAAFDRGEKLMRYQLLDSLADYVLVFADEVKVEHHARQPDGGWTRRIYDRRAQTLPLASVDCQITLEEIYDKVDLPPPTPPSGT